MTDIHERKKGTESETTCEKVYASVDARSGADFLAMEKFFLLRFPTFASVCAHIARATKASERIA